MHTTVFVTDFVKDVASRVEHWTFVNGDEVTCNVDLINSGTCSLIGSSDHMRILAKHLLAVAAEADLKSLDS